AMLASVSTVNTDHGVLCLKRQQLETLIRAGADINENLNYTPLMTALFHRNLGVAKLVHGLGGNPYLQAKADGSTVLHVVAKAEDDNIETVRWLKSLHVSPDVLDNRGETALDKF